VLAPFDDRFPLLEAQERFRDMLFQNGP
jgi:hypothetical protein